MIRAAYNIGTQYLSHGKHGRICTVTDIHRTYNNAGELVRLCYVATHELLGQKIADYDVNDVQIARGKARMEGLPA